MRDTLSSIFRREQIGAWPALSTASGIYECVRGAVMATLTEWLLHSFQVWIDALPRGLLMVFKIRPFAEMVWSHTRRSIARMQEVFFGPTTMSEEPCDVVSALRVGRFRARYVEYAIAFFVAAAKPKPTAMRFIDVSPEFFCEFHASILP